MVLKVTWVFLNSQWQYQFPENFRYSLEFYERDNFSDSPLRLVFVF